MVRVSHYGWSLRGTRCVVVVWNTKANTFCILLLQSTGVGDFFRHFINVQNVRGREATSRGSVRPRLW